MLHTKFRNIPLLLAAASALTVAGLLAAPVPAHALPPVPLAPANCQQFVFPGFTTIHVSEANFDFQFTSNEPTVNGTVTRLGVADSGNITGGIDTNGHVDLNISQGEAALRFTGDVADDGKARGTWNGTPATARWETTAPLKCAKETPKEGPTVSFDPILGGLNVHITDRSGITSQCTYDADGFTRTFRLEANKSTDLKIVPAVPKLDNWNINVTCDNGTSTQTTQFF